MDLRILVSAPGDQDEAAKKAIDSITTLDQIMQPHGHSLTAVNWKDNISTGRASRAQDVINDQTRDCNALIIILGSRIGSSTGEYVSGTVEEFFEYLKANPNSKTAFDVHVFFNDINEQSIFNIDPEQLKSVQNFRKSLNDLGINFSHFSTYTTLQELVHLGLSTLIAKEKPEHTNIEQDPLQDYDELGSDDALETANSALHAATENLKQIGECASLTGNEMSTVTNKYRNQNAAVPPNDVSNILDAHSEQLSPLAAEFKTNINLAYSHHSLAFNIILEDYDEDTVFDELNTLKTSIIEAMDSTQNFLEAIISARAVITSMPRRTSKLIKSKRKLVTIYDNLVNTVEASINDYLSLANILVPD